MLTTPDDPFYEAVLRGLGITPTPNAMFLMYAWRQMEGGRAAYNPWNSTLKLPGSRLYGQNKHGVQEYASPQQGVEATVTTMGHSRYAPIISALKADQSPEQVAEVIIASKWGTGPMLRDVIAMYRRGRFVTAPIAVPPGGAAISTLAVPKAAPAQPRRAPRPQPRRRGFPWWAWLGIAAFTALGGTALYGIIRDSRPMPRLPAPTKPNPRRRVR